VNYSNPNHTVWAGSSLYYDASGPFRAAIAAAGAAHAASATGADQVVYLPAGQYHIQGGFAIPSGVVVSGAGAGLTALYLAYDTPETAPLAYFYPETAGGSWGFRDLSIYVLSFFFNVFYIPAANITGGFDAGVGAGGDAGASARGAGASARIGERFRAERLVIRADAFHNRNGVGGDPGSRAAAWSLNANASFGGGGGYQPAVFRLGPATNTTTSKVVGAFGAAVNVRVTDCDVSGSWNLFQGKVEYGVFARNTLYNGGQAFYFIARQTVIEDNNATGSSPISGGNGLNFAQHIYMARNDLRNVRGNDREVMTYDAEGAMYGGPPSAINATHVVAPRCPGRMDSRFDPTDQFNSAPRGGVINIMEGPGAGLSRRIVEWGAVGASTGNYDSAPCWWQIDQPFPAALSAANLTAVNLVVTFFAGRSLYVGNTFSDVGHFQLYHSGVDNVVAGHTLSRAGGLWVGGMSVGLRYMRNNSLGPLLANPTLRNEFLDNTVLVGHRAPHACDPENMTRATFWDCSAGSSHQSFSVGMDGQGNSGAILGNRFMVFNRNQFTGGNGVLLWGLGNKDCLVGGNHFVSTEIAIGIDQFPVGKDTVINYVLYNNTVV
jgi:hypothetical protein